MLFSSKKALLLNFLKTFLAKRVNTSPRAIVQPVVQTVNLPTTKAIIDGSGSEDDTSDLKFKWEILNGPVNYQHELPAEQTLTLVDLVSRVVIFFSV
jgi:hypothetical protein